jgi:thioester reductase-like protein
VLDFAKHCHARGGLRRLGHVSTAYVAGTYRGRFHEDDLDRGQDFHNTYERSKFEAESLLRERADDLPLQFLRPSIIVGDSRSGWTSSFNVLYWPLRAFALGVYPAIPARRSSLADIVPVDYVADAIIALGDAPRGPDATYNLVTGDRAARVGELVDLAARCFDRRPPRVIPPRLYRLVIHPLLMRRADAGQRGALEHSEAYFPFFSARVAFDDTRAREHLDPHGLEPPEPREYFARLIEFATESRWGKRPVSRSEALARVGSPLPA